MVESVPEILDFVLQLPDQLVLRVVFHVHHGLVVDGLGGVGVLQGAERLLEVCVGGRDAGDHHRPGVTSQRVLKIFHVQAGWRREVIWFTQTCSSLVSLDSL